jgi:hypothetical protein
MIGIMKKIQAARDYASKSYRTIRRVSENCNMVVRDKNAAKHFLDGAEWAEEEFLKNLWHDASETPDLDRRILYEYKPNGVINPQTHIREATYEKIRWKECGYKPINPERIITRWLYVDELCPKKGGDGK